MSARAVGLVGRGVEPAGASMMTSPPPDPAQVVGFGQQPGGHQVEQAFDLGNGQGDQAKIGGWLIIRNSAESARVHGVLAWAAVQHRRRLRRRMWTTAPSSMVSGIAPMSDEGSHGEGGDGHHGGTGRARVAQDDRSWLCPETGVQRPGLRSGPTHGSGPEHSRNKLSMVFQRNYSRFQ